MTDASAAVVEQRVVSVFNSDDDLTNFLAGLRAKYASLYPHVPETAIPQNDHESGHGDASAVMPDTSSASNAIGVAAEADGGPFLPATTQSFEQKISQLRSSLQSLQHILPPRTSTTANLLDSFMAVSGDRTALGAAVNVVSAAVAAALPSANLPDQRRGSAAAPPTTAHAAAEVEWLDATLTGRGAASRSFSAPAFVPETHVTTWSPRRGSTGALLDANPAGVAGAADPANLPPHSITCAQPPGILAPAGADAVPYEDAVGRCPTTVASASVPTTNLDAVPPDPVFSELAAGYSRRALQADSSEASASSFEGRADAPAPAASPRAQKVVNHGVRVGGDSLFGESAAPTASLQAWADGDRAGVWEGTAPAVVVATGELPAGAPVAPLGPPVAATLTLYNQGEQQLSTADWGEYVGAEPSSSQQQQQRPPNHQLEPDVDTGMFGGEGHHQIQMESQSLAAAWRPHVGRSPGRRRAWQLVGEGGASLGAGSPCHHAPPSQDDDGARGANREGGQGVGHAVAPPQIIPRNDEHGGRGLGELGTVRAAGVDTGVEAADTAERGWTWGRPSGPEAGPSDPVMVDATEPGGAEATRESSAAWESSADVDADDGAAVRADVSGGQASAAELGEQDCEAGFFGVSRGLQQPDAVLRTSESPVISAVKAGHGTAAASGDPDSCHYGASCAQPGFTLPAYEVGAAADGGDAWADPQQQPMAFAAKSGTEPAGALGLWSQQHSPHRDRDQRGADTARSPSRQWQVDLPQPQPQPQPHRYRVDSPKANLMKAIDQAGSPGRQDQRSRASPCQDLAARRSWGQPSPWGEAGAPPGLAAAAAAWEPAPGDGAEGQVWAVVDESPGGHQRPRRRWGSPALDSSQQAYSQLLQLQVPHGSETTDAAWDWDASGGAAGAAASPGRGGPAQWQQSGTGADGAAYPISPGGGRKQWNLPGAQGPPSGFPDHRSGNWEGGAGRCISDAQAGVAEVDIGDPGGSPGGPLGAMRAAGPTGVAGEAGEARAGFDGGLQFGAGGGASLGATHGEPLPPPQQLLQPQERAEWESEQPQHRHHQRQRQQQQQRSRCSGALRLLPPPPQQPQPDLPVQDEAATRPPLEQFLRQQTSVHVWLQAGSPSGKLRAASPPNDEVLCGSPMDSQRPPPPAAAAAAAAITVAVPPWSDDRAALAVGEAPAQQRGRTLGSEAAGAADPVLHPAAESLGFGFSASAADVDGNVGLSVNAAVDDDALGGGAGRGEAGGADGASGITVNRGGVAFSISIDGAPSDEGPARRSPRVVSAALNAPAAAVLTAGPLPAAAVPLPPPGAGPLPPGALPGPADWERLNRQLREAGFSALVMAQVGGHVALEPWSAPAAAASVEPAPSSLYRCLSSVLEQYMRRNRLVAELLAATEQSGRVAEQQEAAIRELKRETSAARAAAEKARRELADVSSQQLPKVEARHAAQLGRLRSETAKLKEALRVSELDLTAKTEEIRSLRATVAGLQSASSHTADVEGAALRQRVAQLEALMRTRDKELEKLRTTKEAVVGQAEDGQANALDRAYEAEATARRLEMELTAARTRLGQLEQSLRQRERDVTAMREDLQQIKACDAAASLVAQERSAAAEEAARRAEGEATALRGKVKELEAVLRAARHELEKQRSEAEALRSSAYEEVYRLEDECRTLGADLAAARTRVTQLDHVVRAKERDVARARDEKEAAKAAERERARVAEEVSVKLEAELTTAKVRLTQAEGAVRTRERELAKLAELLRQTQGAEVEAWLKQAKLEEGSRKMENDFTSLRLRVLQLEATLKGRDKECDKLARTVEALKGEAHELTSRLAKSEESARKTEAELATSRGKALSLEGQVRVKEREQERLVRVVEGLKAGDAEVASRQAALEEAARRLDGQLTAAKSRVSALEGVVRARDAAVERLNRQLEALKTADFERTAQTLKSEEAARQQDAEAAALRQRILHLEGQLRAKDRELERAARQMDATAAAEADAARRLADAAAAAARLEGEVAAGRTRAAQLGEALRGRERELAVLSRALEAQCAAEHEASAVAGRTEQVARKLDGEAAEMRQRLVAAEGQLRTREREAERQARALEAAQTAAAEAALRQSEAEATVRRLEADAAGLRQRLAQAEGAVRARDKELERAEKAADQARGGEAAAEAKLKSAEATVAQLDGELSAMRLRISQLETAARGHSKEMERLTRAMDQTKVAQVDAATRAQRSDESARQVAAELTSARSRLSKLEASLAAREQEAQRVQRLLVAAEVQAATQASRSDDFVRRVEADLGTMRQQAAQLAQLLRTRDRQMTTLRGALETAQAAEAKAAEQRRQSEEALRKVEGDLVAERQRAVQLEGQVKSRDRDLERLSRQLDAGRDQSHTAAAVADRETCSLKDSAARAEAALATARARLTQLESELVAKERQLEGLQRLAGSSRAGDAEAAATAEERARRSEEAARRLDAELGAVRQRYTHLEHNFRSRETTLEKLKAALAEKVAQEERRVARDKAAYQRIRAAYVATLGQAAGGGGSSTPGNAGQQQQRAAGAMAAAARELRPVEIVGLYETRREAAEQELAAYRAEVRSLADQLREAQNHIAIKDRTGAWRTPTELADMQARIILLERRSADLQRELDRAQLKAAEAARTAERRLAEAEHRAVQLKEDNEALVHELDSRPTLQDNRTLKREVEILEKRLLQLKGSTAANGAGADAEGGETALSLAVAAKSRHTGSMLTTQQRIARDRSLHRLGLRALEDWPKDVLVDLLQDVCIELDLRDATTLPAAVRKTLRVVSAVPRMESFIGAVCERVYLKGAPFMPPHINGTTDPSRVLEVLEVWLGLLQEGAQLRGAMRAVVEALAARADGMATPIHGPGDVVVNVRQLVEAEVAALTARESLAAATQHMAREPEHLLSRLVSHFMRLFDCPSLEGVVPAVNRLYVTLNELRNFARALATALELPADAGPSACMSRVHELLGARANGGDVAIAAPGNKRPPESTAAAQAGRVESTSVTAAGGADIAAALERFMLVFGVRTPSAAAEAAEKAVARLRRLDEVLPRYQRLASQLFETLRCTSLEEIIPALKALLQWREEQQPA